MESNQQIILPKKVIEEATNTTERERRRRKEDAKYLPVIVKRVDEVVRHPDDTLEHAIEEGLEQHNRTSLSLFISAMAAGLILGFTAMCIGLVSQLLPETSSPTFSRFIMAIFYPLGFIICITSRTQLFTEQTATAVYPILDKKSSVKSLMRLLAIVLVGNFIGTFISSSLIVLADNVTMASQGMLDVYQHLIHYQPTEVFISAVLAGWLMAQGGWLVLSTPPSTSQIISIYIVTFIIGFGGLHHSIAGSAEIFAGLLISETPQLLSSFNFLLFAVLGNFVGGSIFVAILNYSHIKKTQVPEGGKNQ
jgi:formate/nitrite transporter FocA (FNT family)